MGERSFPEPMMNAHDPTTDLNMRENTHCLQSKQGFLFDEAGDDCGLCRPSTFTLKGEE